MITKDLVPTFDPFLAMDRLDDDLIIRELKGEVIQEYVYSFDQSGKKVEGLSKKGVDAAVGELARKGEVIRELTCDVFRDTDAYEFTVKAGRYAVSADGKEVLLDTKLGFKRQLKSYENGKANPFFFEQGGAKAARNAAKRLLPEDLIVKLLAEYKKAGKVRTVTPTAATIKTVTAEVRQDVEDLYGKKAMKGVETFAPQDAQGTVSKAEEKVITGTDQDKAPPAPRKWVNWGEFAGALPTVKGYPGKTITAGELFECATLLLARPIKRFDDFASFEEAERALVKAKFGKGL